MRLVSGANSVFSIHLRKVNNRRVFKWRKTFLGSGSAGGYEVVVLCNSIHSTRCLRLRCGCGLIHYFSFSFFFYYFVTGTFLSSTMGKVKTFVCFVLYFAHQRWHSHYRGEKKNHPTRCRRKTSCFDTRMVSHGVGDERQIGLYLTKVRNTKGKHRLGLTSHAGGNCGVEGEKKKDLGIWKNTLDRLTRERIWAPIMKPTMIERTRGAEISPTITRRGGNAGGGGELNSTNTCKGLLGKPNPSWAGSLG